MTAIEDAIVEWLGEHAKTPADIGVLLEFLARVIHSTWPMGLTKGVELKGNQFWAFQAGPQVAPEEVAATQIIVASLNADWPTVTALIKAQLKQDDAQRAARVVFHVLKATSDGLRVAANAHEESQ